MYHPTFLITYQIPGIARKNSRVAYSNLCLIAPYNITVGRGMGKNLRAEYEEVIVKHGLLTSFYSKEEKQSSDEELLKFYMKSETNRDRFWEEIETFRTKSSQLEALYHRERGRVLSGKLKRKLKEIGATGHFAVVDNVIVASAPTKKELDARVTEIMPEEKKEWVHRFKI